MERLKGTNERHSDRFDAGQQGSNRSVFEAGRGRAEK
jgi:hypothetical protein